MRNIRTWKGRNSIIQPWERGEYRDKYGRASSKECGSYDDHVMYVT